MKVETQKLGNLLQSSKFGQKSVLPPLNVDPHMPVFTTDMTTLNFVNTAISHHLTTWQVDDGGSIKFSRRSNTLIAPPTCPHWALWSQHHPWYAKSLRNTWKNFSVFLFWKLAKSGHPPSIYVPIWDDVIKKYSHQVECINMVCYGPTELNTDELTGNSMLLIVHATHCMILMNTFKAMSIKTIEHLESCTASFYAYKRMFILRYQHLLRTG